MTWRNPRPSFSHQFESAAKHWNRTVAELRCTEERFGESMLVQLPETGECDGALTSSWAGAHALTWMLPAKATRVPIEIADTLLSHQPLKKCADMSRVSFPLPRPKTVTKPNWKADKFYADFADAIWTIDAAHGAVCMSDDRPSMFAKLSRIVPDWINFPEAFVWISDHTTGAKSAGGSRYTIQGMAERLREGPIQFAAIVDDTSIRRRILERAQPKRPQPTTDQLRSVIDFFRQWRPKPASTAYELPNLAAVSFLRSQRPQVAA